MAYDIGPARKISEAEFRGLFSRLRVKPHENLMHYSDENRVANYVFEGLNKNLETGTSALELRVDGKLLALSSLSPLEFDSSFFGVSMGQVGHLLVSDELPAKDRRGVSRALLESATDAARLAGLQQLTVRVPPRDYDVIQACMDAGFDFIDVLVTYAIDIRKMDGARIEPPNDIIIRTQQDGDTRRLQGIAADSFVKDRFHSDRRFNREAADAFHAKWIENSLNGTIADAVIVAEIDGNPVGFTTLKDNPDLSRAIGIRVGSMVLSAVDEAARGKRVYTHMIAGGLRWFRNKADVVDLGTQIDNIPVQRAWCWLGFKPATHAVTLHWWGDSL